MRTVGLTGPRTSAGRGAGHLVTHDNFVDQGLDHGRVVHVDPDEHRLARPVGLTVGPLQKADVGDGVEREALRLDQLGDRCTQLLLSLAGEQVGSGGSGRLFPDVWLASKTVATLKPRTTGFLVSLSPTLGLSPRRNARTVPAITSQPASRSPGSQHGISPAIHVRHCGRGPATSQILRYTSATARELDPPHTLSHAERRLENFLIGIV